MSSRATRVAKGFGKGVGYLVGFVMLVVAAALLAIQTPWAQRYIAKFASEQASNALQGRVEVTLDGSLSLVGLSNLSARLLPADVNDAAPIVELRGVQASWDLSALVRSLVGGGPLVVGIDHVEVEGLLLDLRADPDGNLALTEAVAPAQPSAEESPPSQGPSPLIHLEGLDIFDARILLPAETRTDAGGTQTTVQPVATIDRIHAEFDMQDLMSGVITVSSIEAPVPGTTTVFFGDLSAAGVLGEDDVATAQTTVEGNLQGVPVSIFGVYHAEEWSAQVNVDGSAEAWRDTGVGFEPTAPVAATVLALGDLKTARVHATVLADDSKVAADADLTFSPFAAEGALSVQQASPRTFASAAPPGSLNVSAGFSAQSEPQRANLSLALRNSTLEGKVVPDLDLSAVAHGSSRAEFRLATTDDSGLELAGHVENTERAVTFGVEGSAKRLPNYEGAPQLRALDVRDLQLDAHGTWRGEPQALSATLNLDVDRVVVPSAQLAVTNLSARVSTEGELEEPSLDGTISVDTLTAGDLSASNVRIEAATVGRQAPRIRVTSRVRLAKDAPPRDVLLRTTLASLSPVHATDTELQFASKQRRLRATIADVRVGDGMAVDAVHLTGVGELHAELKSRGNDVEARAQIEGLDLPSLSELFQPFVPPLTGQVTANAAVQTKGERLAAASLFARATNVGTEQARADNLEASMVVEDEALSGTLRVERGRSRVRLDTKDVDLSIRNNTNFSAKDFRGQVSATVFAHTQDFPELEKQLEEIHVEGLVRSLVVIHQSDSEPLTVKSMVRLNDVTVRPAEPRVPDDSAKDEQGRADAADSTTSEPEWALTDLYADWTTSYDGANGKWANSLVTGDSEHAGDLATVYFSTRVPLAQMNAQLAEIAPQLPLEGTLVIPRTPLAALPGGTFVPTGVDAFVQADIAFSGTVSAPEVEGKVRVQDLQVSSSNTSFPVSLVLDAKASKDAIAAQFRLFHENLTLVSGKLDGAPPRNEWHALASIDELPLGRLPYVRDYGVTGSVSGKVEFDSGQNDPSIAAKIEAKDLRAYGETMPTVTIDAKLADGEGKIVTEIRQTSGFVQLQASAVSNSGQLADYHPARVRLESRSFEIRPLLLALQGSVSDLSGVLDGVVEVAFDSGETNASGAIQLQDGVVLIPALGKQVRDIDLTLRAAPGRLELSRLSAKVERGSVQGEGKLAYSPEGRFSGELNLRLPSDERLPIANKGRDIAEASGRINVKASMDPGEEMKIAVDVPELDVYFSDSATDKVGDTKRPDFVTVGTYVRDGHFVSLTPAEETPEKDADTEPVKPTIITVNLGKDVWLHQGTSTFAGIDGTIEARIAETTRLYGKLNLAEGRIDIQGRVFDIRPGTVVFHGANPPNPDVVAEAAWTSPSDYTVIATYRGSVQNGKVTLRSEPPLSYGEILNVLLFDDPEGAGDSEGSPGAGGVAATVASAGLSKSLTSLTDLDIQANLDTDAAGSPRPELGVRLSPRLAVQVAYVLQPATQLSQPPDRAFVSFDWRLSNAWTLEATLGDHGSAATDVTWKYRY